MMLINTRPKYVCVIDDHLKLIYFINETFFNFNSKMQMPIQLMLAADYAMNFDRRVIKSRFYNEKNSNKDNTVHHRLNIVRTINLGLL